MLVQNKHTHMLIYVHCALTTIRQGCCKWITACDGDQEWAAHEKSAINKCANLLFPIFFTSANCFQQQQQKQKNSKLKYL